MMSPDYLQPHMVVQAGQVSVAGRRPDNEDCIGMRLPEGLLQATKGYAMVLADGVSAAEGGQEAAHSVVTGFLSDYYSTPDTWSTVHSVRQVLLSLNSWLHGRSLNRHQSQLSYLTTLTATVIKARTAHIFHIGDCRLYLYRTGELLPLTRDHRVATRDGTQLTRAMGMDFSLDIDYRKLVLEAGDILLTTSDGLHDTVGDDLIARRCGEWVADPQALCDSLRADAEQGGSTDNISVQALLLSSLRDPTPEETWLRLSERAFPPLLEPGQCVDGFRIEAELHASERSQVYRVIEEDTGQRLVMKTPSPLYADDTDYIERFALEQWMGSRLQNQHVVRVLPQPEGARFLYYLTEYLQGPPLEKAIRLQAPFEVSEALRILEEMIRGLRAFHRRDMLHRDIKPANVLLTERGAVWVDFGSATARGVAELGSLAARELAQGTAVYSAPEVHAGEPASRTSEQFSLGVILYEMLTGRHPYGDTYAEQARRPDRLQYQPAARFNPLVPAWLDRVILRSVDPLPAARYPALGDWLHDLRNPRIAHDLPAASKRIDMPGDSLWLTLLIVSGLANLALLWLLWQS
ncbi:bifunctional protein-serine/threonine kinase/phosphatase [Natronospirillum operosum]|uniref:non-specific serine/threonine protein kinase n=1 Tax=Natronospirillum operosum TaxID=2759953 RepID=A0A4Z0WKA4_9GAMM|nr:bifunctional protein-serine/threonine kinase/phosphatase [Natronospirillum operosum]TGG95655.1 bifunctional protein-serine/threonine kinase/phosphatase [Natronospirillum operosum]